MLSKPSLAQVGAFWHSYLGADLGRGAPVLVVPHAAALADYDGAKAWMRNGHCVMSVPKPVLNRARDALSGLSAEEAFDTGTLAMVFADALDRIVGPAWIGYRDEAGGLPPADDGVRRIGPDDELALRRLAHACGEVDWGYGGVEPYHEAIFGCVADGLLVAVASYERWGDVIAHVGFVTHPAYRHRGFGRAVASAATRDAIERGLIAQWQTLESNAPSLAVGLALDYEPYCRTIAVRFRR